MHYSTIKRSTFAVINPAKQGEGQNAAKGTNEDEALQYEIGSLHLPSIQIHINEVDDKAEIQRNGEQNHALQAKSKAGIRRIHVSLDSCPCRRRR